MNEEHEELLYDETESIWKIDGPIGRLDYLWVTIGLIFLSIIPLLLIKTIALFLLPVGIIIALVGIYVSFVAVAKRFYDITGEKKLGVIVAIILWVAQLLFAPIGFVTLALCLFMPGKYIK